MMRISSCAFVLVDVMSPKNSKCTKVDAALPAKLSKNYTCTPPDDPTASASGKPIVAECTVKKGRRSSFLLFATKPECAEERRCIGRLCIEKEPHRIGWRRAAATTRTQHHHDNQLVHGITCAHDARVALSQRPSSRERHATFTRIAVEYPIETRNATQARRVVTGGFTPEQLHPVTLGPG